MAAIAIMSSVPFHCAICSTQGHAGGPFWCLPGPGRGALPIQPVGPGAEASRGGGRGRLQLLSAGQHRALDRPWCRRLRWCHQGVPGPMPRCPEIQPLWPQTVKNDWERAAKGSHYWKANFKSQFRSRKAFFQIEEFSIFACWGSVSLPVDY